MKVILYARVSTRGQVDKGYSLRQQMEALRTYAGQRGYEVLAEVPDDGYSGITLDRPGLDRARGLVETGAWASCSPKTGTASHVSPLTTTS